MNTKFWNATNLKIIACLLMFIDHIHEMFVGYGLVPHWLNIPGRLVFPIFLFLAADSFHYTHNRCTYMTRLFLASCLMLGLGSIITSIFPNDTVMVANNAFGTFFMTGLYIIAYDTIKDGILERRASYILKGLGLAVLPILSVLTLLLYKPIFKAFPFLIARIIATFLSMIPNILAVEGGYFLVMMGLLFYVFRKNRFLQMLILLVFSVMAYYMDPSSYQWLMGLAIIPMWLYNGQKGSGHKYFFYIFYPVHIYGLYILATLMMGR